MIALRRDGRSRPGSGPSEPDSPPKKTPFELSVGSADDCYNNALAETIHGFYKAEVIHRRGPERPFEAIEYSTLEWIDWFNHRRLLEPIGNIPPAEAAHRYYAMLDDNPKFT